MNVTAMVKIMESLSLGSGVEGELLLLVAEARVKLP
jgi:hypothetical protein